jgi:hypothetical protein
MEFDSHPHAFHLPKGTRWLSPFPLSLEGVVCAGVTIFGINERVCLLFFLELVVSDA